MHACKCHVVGQARKEALEAANAAYIAQEKMGAAAGAQKQRDRVRHVHERSAAGESSAHLQRM